MGTAVSQLVSNVLFLAFVTVVLWFGRMDFFNCKIFYLQPFLSNSAVRRCDDSSPTRAWRNCFVKA